MTEPLKFKAPWMVAVWPGMGHIAINAGFYLAAKLGMRNFASCAPWGLWEVEHVEVERGIVQPARLPRNRLFSWRDPLEQHDLVLSIGEAQLPTGKQAYCKALVRLAKEFGVERVFTFAAMATQMHPEQDSRVFVAATDQATLDEMMWLENLHVMEEGRISGMNGVFLGVVAEAGLHGACLLGEMPHVFAHLPFPGGSLAVLKAFTRLMGLNLDLNELMWQAEDLGRHLKEMFPREEEAQPKPAEPAEEEGGELEHPEPPKLSPADEQRIEELFRQAQQDRSKAYELKRELDRLDVFREYEDRFLDLFQKPET
uniref:PAC2 family protein n=1 Tax=Schlesneria paludicola TaxID=360056 RepID=A0A7C4QV38_9PLAN